MIIIMTIIIKSFEAPLKASPEIQKQKKYRLKYFAELSSCRKKNLTTNLVQG